MDNHAFAGIMFRETLEEDSKAAAVGLSFVKYTNTTWSVLLASRKTTGGAMSDLTESIDSESAATKAGIPLIADIPFRVQKDKQSITQGTWLKLVRQGDTFSAYTSQDNVTWTLVGSQEIEMAEDIYVGFAVDGNKVANEIDNMSWAQFSNISIKNDLHNITADFTNVSVDGLATTIAGGDDLNITLVPDNGYQLPESITVTVGGVEVEAEYEFATGNVTIKNVTGDVVIKAVGTVKAAAARENYEIIDLNSEFPLSVSEENGVMTLTQSATKGSMADSNVSYLVFPATEDEGTLSMKVKVKSFNYEKGSGVFIGAFMPDNNSGSRYFMSLGMRNPAKETGNSLSAYWYKATSIGNGSPKTTLALDTEYEVEISWDKSNQMVATWTPKDGSSDTKTFKLSECHADLYDHENEDKSRYIAERRFGIAISGATAEITDLVYCNSEGEELFNQDVDGSIGAPEVGTLNVPVIAEDNSSISVSWTGKETLAENDAYAVEITKDDKLIKKFTTTEKTYTLSVVGDGSDNGVYAFKVYGVNGTATTVAQTVSVELNVEEPKVQDGFKATTAKEGITYYFDFQDATSDIWNKGEAEAAAQGTSLKTGELGLLTVVSAGKFHSADHGMNNVAEFNIQVAGNCTISIGGCKFTGDSDIFTMSSTTGTLDAAQKASKTTNCYSESCVDGSDRVVFTYTGEAGSVNLKCPGAYVPRIIVTPVVVVDTTPDENEPKVQDGTQATVAKTGITYYYNFQDATSDIWDMGEAEEAVQGTSLKTGNLGLLTVVSAGKFHSADHGMNQAATFNIQVAGNSKISIGGCAFTGENDVFTMTSTTGTLDAEQKAAKTTNCYNENCTDGTDRVTFVYTGEAGSVTFTSVGSYIPCIIVESIVEEAPRVIEVWDFAGQEESDTDLYHNNITTEGWAETGLVGSEGALDSSGSKMVTFGQLTMVYENGDVIYDVNSTSTYKNYSNYEYEDGYVSDGLWYCNGKGGSGKRCITINDVKAGDKVVAYMGSHTAEVDELHFLYKGTEGTQDDVATVGNKECKKYEFIAKYDGSYQIYVGASTNVKPVWHRIMLVPAAQVSGNIDIGTLEIADYGVKFINNTTEEEFEGIVENGEFTVSLTPGYEYTAVLTGVVGYGFTTASKVITVPDSAVDGGLNDVILVVEEKDVQLLSGTISGFDADVDLTKVKIVLVAAENSQKENASVRPAADGSYSIYVESGVSYTLTLEGANDYQVTGDTAVCLTEAATKNIVVEKKPVYTVSGEFIGLAEGTEVTALTFVNMDDEYAYEATISGNSYSIDLRNGVYEVEATVSGYTTLSHVIVENGAVARDLLFTSTAKLTAIPYVADIYVGYPEQENNYDSVRAAVTACKAMRLTNGTDRITVHIAPGVYREQVIVDVPYITFKNDTPEQEVKLTWYYGIGYEYYSIGSDGYYSEAAAFDKFSKNTAQKWGAATYIKGAATEFRAEYITFESSFNKYMTEEEIADGVEPGGNDKKDFARTASADVASRAAVERATALAVEGNQSEFLGCKIVSSQDTLYTGNNVKAYFKNCFIDGNTDYIFGGGDFVFDGCELSFYGYSDEESGAYITAAADGSTYGYVFRNCYVSTNDDWAVAPGYLGRPWRQAAKVSFINTKMESATTILPIGWHDMSGNTAANADYREYGSTLVNGEAIDVSGRLSGKVVSENPYSDITTVFAGWTPVYFVADSDNVALESEIKVATNGAKDVKVGDILTVKFSLGENEDANVSAIKWYRVAADGTETLVKTAFAQLDRTYTVTEADLDATLKVVISPETVSGYKTEEQQLIITELEVDGESGDVSGGEGQDPTPGPTATPEPTATPVPTTTPAPVTQDEQNGVTYKIEGNGVTVTEIDQTVADVVIPDTVIIEGKEYKVTSIPKNAFKNNKKLTSIIIGNNVTSIGDYAFYGCTNLKTVKIGKNVVTIGKCAFGKNASLTSITIPDKVKTVGVNAFDGCSKLKTVKLGKSLTVISDKMFYKCKALTKVTIPAKVTKIGKSAFASCTKLSSVTVGKKVVTIDANAFYKCTALKKVTIPASVKTIGGSAFSGCTKLATLTIGKKVATIDKNAFSKCTSLKKVSIPASVKTIGANAFNGCKNLKSITIKTTKLTSKNVGNKAFSGINAKATIKVPSKKLADYKKLLVSKGVKKTATIKK